MLSYGLFKYKSEFGLQSDIVSSSMESTNVIPVWCEDIYYKIALQIDAPSDLLAFAAATKSLRAVTHLLIDKSRLEVCVAKTPDDTSYVNMNPNTVIHPNDKYVTISDWCNSLLTRTANMHSLQKTQYYKNIRGMMFVNAYITPAGKTLAFMRCNCGLLSTNRIMFEVAKLDTIHNTSSSTNMLSNIYRSLWPAQSYTSRRLIIDCHHMCKKCMYNDARHTTPIALNNYAKATLSTTLHLNGSKIIIRNNGWITLLR
ncbi:hypothetical protein F-VV10_0438 [Faustovirus]|nr:hypothetical protein F-VV10_0438 [Faustovirus]